MKLISKISLLSLLAASNLYCDQLNRKQASKYIGHVIDTLLVPTAHEGKYGTDLKNWIDDCKEDLLTNSSLYKNDRHEGRIYSSDKIYDSLLNEVVKLIEETSYKYAKKELNKKGDLSNSSIEHLSDKISLRISEKIYNIIDSSSTLQSGAFQDYIGAPLNSKVRSMIEKELQKDSYKPSKRYKSEKKHKRYKKDYYETEYSEEDRYQYVAPRKKVVTTYKVVPVAQPVYVPAYRVAYAAPRITCVSPVIRPSFGFSICL